jgi:hypothetical protein
MYKTLLFLFTFALPLLVNAAEPERLKLTTPTCSCGVDCTCDPCSCYGDYTEAYNAALRSDRPLVVFINVPSTSVRGAVLCSSKGLPGLLPVGVVVAVPSGGELEVRAEIYGPANETRIKQFLQKTPAKRIPTVPAEGAFTYATPAFAPRVQQPFFFPGGSRGCIGGG